MEREDTIVHDWTDRKNQQPKKRQRDDEINYEPEQQQQQK